MVVLNTLTAFIILFSVSAYGVSGGGWYIKPVSIDFEPWIVTNGYAVGYNITATPFNVLITVSYWAAYEITTTGFDCFQPNRYAQVIALIMGMLIGSIMIPYMTVRVLSIRSNVNQALAAFQENMRDLTVFMKTERVHYDLQEEALSYYAYTWEKTGGSNYRSILKLCDQITLRTDAILHIYGQTFHKCPILYKCDQSLQRLIGRAVHNVYYRAGMTVIERDDVTTELYFVDYGIMEARDPEDDDLIANKLPRGSMFGNLDNKTKIVCPNRFVASTNLHLLMIESWLFYQILKDFPAIRARMVKFRPQHDETYIIARMRQSVARGLWKERVLSAAIIVVTRQGVLNYLHTHGKVLQIILIIASIISVYGDLYNAVFQDNRVNLIVLLYLIDVLFICKIAINYSMPNITEEKSESRKALVQAQLQYYRGEFKYDILSVIPIELLGIFFVDHWSAFAYLRLNRFLRVTTIHSTLNQYHERLSINLTATTIIATLIWFTLFVHTCTCIWQLLGVIHDNIEPKTSWRWDSNKTYFCTNEYICSFYFVMTTFSQNGVGDILPRQHAEVIFVILLMIISTMMYMIYVGEFSNIMQYQFFRCFSFYKEFLELKEFLKYNNVSHNLMNLTNRYTLHLWRTSRGLQVPLFLKNAPPRLRHRLMAAAYMLHLKKHPSFKHCERPFLRHVVAHFKPFAYLEEMYVVREGEITNSMYFVHKGRVKEIIEDFEESSQIFEKGDFFGTTQGLNHETPYVHSYKTITKSQVLTLSLDDWEYLLQHFPQNKETIYKPHKGLPEYKEKKHVVITKTADIHRYAKDEEGTQRDIPAKPHQLTRILSERILDSTSDITRSRSSIRFEKPVSQDKPTSDEVKASFSRESSPERLSTMAASSLKAIASRTDQRIPKRKSTILDINKPMVKKELEQPEDAVRLDSIGATDRYVKSQLKTSPRQLSPLSSEISQWPLDSRRKLSIQESSGIKEYQPKSLNRRGTAIQGSDKTAVKELKDEEDDENTRSPAYHYSRRKSTIYGIDKNATDKELLSLKDLRRFSEGDEKSQVKGPVALTRLTGIPSGQKSEDNLTISQPKSAINFRNPSESEPLHASATDLKDPVDGTKSSPSTKSSRELLSILPSSSIAAAAFRSADNITAHSSKDSEDMLHLTIQKRRSTVMDIEKPVVKEELKQFRDKDVNPLDSRHAIDEYLKSQMKKTVSDTQSPKIIRWPLDSRHKSSYQERPVLKEDKPIVNTSKETDDLTKPTFIRHDITIQGIDKAAVGKKLSSDDQDVEDTQKPVYDYSRRKSTIYDVDKSASEKELPGLKDIHRFSEYDEKPQAKVPAPSGQTSHDVPFSKSKSAIRFGIPTQSDSDTKQVTNVHWPLDNQKTDGLSKPKFIQRDTTIQRTHKAAVEQELKERSSYERNTQDTSKPDYSRSKSISEGSSVEETELKTTYYEPDEGRSILAPSHESDKAFERVPSIHIPTFEPNTEKRTSLKPIIGKTSQQLHENPPAIRTKRTKSFLERLLGVKKLKSEDAAKDNLMLEQEEAATTSALLSYEKNNSIKPSSNFRSRSGVSFSEPEKLQSHFRLRPSVSFPETPKEHKSSILFKDEVKTFEIPKSVSSENEDDKPSTSQRGRFEPHLNDNLKKKDHTQISVKYQREPSKEEIELKVLKSASIESVESVRKLLPDKKGEAKGQEGKPK